MWEKAAHGCLSSQIGSGGPIVSGQSVRCCCDFESSITHRLPPFGQCVMQNILGSAQPPEFILPDFDRLRIGYRIIQSRVRFVRKFGQPSLHACLVASTDQNLRRKSSDASRLSVNLIMVALSRFDQLPRIFMGPPGKLTLTTTVVTRGFTAEGAEKHRTTYGPFGFDDETRSMGKV